MLKESYTFDSNAMVIAGNQYYSQYATSGSMQFACSGPGGTTFSETLPLESIAVQHNLPVATMRSTASWMSTWSRAQISRIPDTITLSLTDLLSSMHLTPAFSLRLLYS